jgi:hypothetical protein
MTDPFELTPGWQDRLHERLSAMTQDERANWFAETNAGFAKVKRHFVEFHEMQCRREIREQIRREEEELAARQRALDAERSAVAERRAAIGK